MASLLLDPFFTVLDANGKPVNNAKVYVYDEGTTDAASIYSDKTLSTALSQPVRTNSAGKLVNGSNTRVNIYVAGGQNYKVTIKTSADVAVDEIDSIIPYAASDGGTLPIVNGGTGASTDTGALSALGAASDSALSSLSTTVSELESQVDGIGGDLGDMAAKDNVELTDFATGLDGLCIQRVRATSATKSSLSGATVPQDTTTPQVTEGEQVFSQSFTPTRSDSIIRVRSRITVEYSATRQAIYMLFTSGSTDCIQSGHAECAANTTQSIEFEHEFASPGTSAITISTRIGADSTTAPQINGPHFSTVPVSFLLIEEIIDTPVS